MDFDNQVIIQDGRKEKRIYTHLYEKTGINYLHLREFYDKDGSMQPGKGISFPIEKGEEIIAAITKAIGNR